MNVKSTTVMLICLLLSSLTVPVMGWGGGGCPGGCGECGVCEAGVCVYYDSVCWGLYNECYGCIGGWCQLDCDSENCYACDWDTGKCKPYCDPVCEYCEEGDCYLKSGSYCGINHDCEDLYDSECCDCIDCQCEDNDDLCGSCFPQTTCYKCLDGECLDDPTKCTGECHNGCWEGCCIDDDSKCDPYEVCCNGECCGDTRQCMGCGGMTGECEYLCCACQNCIDGTCVGTRCCVPDPELTESGECDCIDKGGDGKECSGTITLTFSWSCVELYTSCPSGTDCVQTGWEDCYTTWTKECIGECETSADCGVDFTKWDHQPKAPRCLCGCK